MTFRAPIYENLKFPAYEYNHYPLKVADKDIGEDVITGKRQTEPVIVQNWEEHEDWLKANSKDFDTAKADALKAKSEGGVPILPNEAELRAKYFAEFEALRAKAAEPPSPPKLDGPPKPPAK